MAYQQVTAPTVEPLLLAEVKTHLREDLLDAANDALISFLITAVRQFAENETNRSFITQSWKYVFDSFPGIGLMGTPWGSVYSQPGNALMLEKGPIQSIDSIQYLDMTGTMQTVAASVYTSDLTGDLARLAPKFGQIWPIPLPQMAACQVNFTAGYGVAAASVPEGLRQWMKLRIASLYENREEFVIGRGLVVAKSPNFDGLLDRFTIRSA